ncbi:hypothetical protein DAPPUDRAFT_305112 [Daphnia pulex]|uniref:WD repeat-containing protein 75 second beta-propeller domain-containing protein n=1 Tax=Daphnia pulex TaxID=6669 RepID=E9GNZ8_DAPPU|nr:hypothetical protein DAPPUDRAFT_305112 [Daphnia pulex]|eukprot:EFX78840.1 hypothetical protein DAPPUDRAFT_305112 [Daphnia pulex]
MANKKARGPDKAKPNTDNIVVKKQEDAPDIVRQPPVFTDDSKYLCIASGRQVGIYSVQSGDKVHCLKNHSFDIIGLAIKEENVLYSCDTSGEVIEWDINDGKLLKKTSIAVEGLKEFYSFHYPRNGKFLVSSPSINEDGSSLFMFEGKRIKKIFKDVGKETQSIAFGCDQGDGSLVIGALNYQCDGVMVKDTKNVIDRKHMTDKRKFTCIAMHKEKLIMATGDISGRILIWHDFVNQIRPVKTVYHWHTLAVSSVCFSSEAEYLYSGGSEKVMVKWRLGGKRKQFLPRMGSTIKFIVNAPDNICVATSHSDNAIRIIDSTNKINRAIFGLVKHDPIRGLEDGESKKESVMPTGLVFDPRTQGIFFNSQAGFLQLFDPLRDSMIFNMDIANRNVLTDERNTVIGNAEVFRVAVSPTGEWLATLEVWSNMSVGYHDMNLKFWRYDAVQANYELNTDVTMPHHDRITSLAFQPGLLGTEYPCLVSIGRDLKFKIWRLVDDTDIYRQKESWTCDVAGDFRKMMPTATSFSEDGSLLAIAFQDTVTLWDPMTINLNTTLSHNLIEESIELMEFGRDQCFRYLVCASKSSLFAWDVISKGLVWKVGKLRSPIRCLVPDPKSSYMAVVLQNSEVFVFAPSSSKPVHTITNVMSSEPIAALFVPRPNPLANSPEWLVNSRLLIVDDQQEFYSVDDNSVCGFDEKLTTPISHMDSLPWTPFSAIKAQKQISAAKQIVPVIHQTNGIKGYKSVQSLLETSTSTLPPMSRICNSFMIDLMIKHDPKSMTVKADSENGATNDLPTLMNGHIESKMPALKEEATQQKLLTLDCQWITKN